MDARPMTKPSQIFDDKWLERASANSAATSWAREVIETLDRGGKTYLCTVRSWFDGFPLKPKQKEHLRLRLESLRNDQHLGGVNELAWWAFMLRETIAAAPLPPLKTPRPDFELQPPHNCFVEVSTLNVSQNDQKKIEANASIALDDAVTIRRLVRKLTDKKRNQLKYAADRAESGVLVIFDYTTWSGYGTQFDKAIGEFLLGQPLGFQYLPPELSALVYVERRVFDGRIGLSCHRSAMFHSPLALYPLPVATFSSLRQFRLQLVSVKSESIENWLWLS
jgi:hypothetical protein